MRLFALCGVFLFAAISTQADADCGRLTLITSTELKIGADNRPYVPVEIGGEPKYMLVDTGGLFTEIGSATASELKLEPRHTNLQLVGVEGQMTRLAVRSSLKLGNLQDTMDFMVDPSGDLGDALSGGAGILAPNLLRSYDVDFDFGGGKFNLLSQDHCDGQVVYWPADGVGVVPFTLSYDGHIMLSVTLDGEHFTATLDSGASTSVLERDRAVQVFGLKLGDPDTPAVGSLANFKQIAVYRHKFKTLTLEGISVGNPTMTLLPDIMGQRIPDPHDSIEGDTRIRDRRNQVGMGDMILGMDVLRRFHLYIAYKEQKLYITGANPPAASTAAQTQGSAAH
jgi:predicted aspartyl protease